MRSFPAIDFIQCAIVDLIVLSASSYRLVIVVCPARRFAIVRTTHIVDHRPDSLRGVIVVGSGPIWRGRCLDRTLLRFSRSRIASVLDQAGFRSVDIHLVPIDPGRSPFADNRRPPTSRRSLPTSFRSGPLDRAFDLLRCASVFDSSFSANNARCRNLRTCSRLFSSHASSLLIELQPIAPALGQRRSSS